MINYHSIISVENLLAAWKEFLLGKKQKADVQAFSSMLMDNIITLHDDLANFSYVHGTYKHFKISDPKPRDIHKATVQDRLLHHAICRKLYPFFAPKLIADSFSCQLDKGTHRAINRFRKFTLKVSRNNTYTCWVLKGDIKKFFASIDHQILKDILAAHIQDTNTLWLLGRVVDSHVPGLPLGNLTSQLLVNIYMNAFDQWIKHSMKATYYIRYADDFVILSYDRSLLEELLPKIGDFLKERLHLQLHPNKILIKTLSSGVDFLGWVHFPDHRVLRTVTKKRMLKRVQGKSVSNETRQSYRGLLGHGNAKKLQQLL